PLSGSPAAQAPPSDTPSSAGTGTPLRPPLLLQRVCSTFRLSLLVLGFHVLLLVAVGVIGTQSEGRRGQRGEGRFFRGHEGSERTRKAHMPPACRSLDHAALLLHLKHFPMDLRILTCQMAFFQSNGTQCCPVNWLEFEGSCYWFSRSGKTWAEADRYCQLENAHLVVINSREEQKFIVQHTNPYDAWIGLTDSEGAWKWVDGTDYHQSYKNWAATQPDDWQGHEVGGGEDCAEVRANGPWNDNLCEQVQRWVCEMRRNGTA
uniref:Asialoglycoprotein receptor 2 n=1 Tax=Ursus maritimus TaxID=29073 RepID=A0A452UH32_URSMA